MKCICGHPVHANIGGCGVCNSYGCFCEKLFPFPQADEWGRPTEKLPVCPGCGQDELGLIHPHYLLCYACGWESWSDDAEQLQHQEEKS